MIQLDDQRLNTGGTGLTAGIVSGSSVSGDVDLAVSRSGPMRANTGSFRVIAPRHRHNRLCSILEGGIRRRRIASCPQTLKKDLGSALTYEQILTFGDDYPYPGTAGYVFSRFGVVAAAANASFPKFSRNNCFGRWVCYARFIGNGPERPSPGRTFELVGTGGQLNRCVPATWPNCHEFGCFTTRTGYSSFIAGVDTVVMGRRTYEQILTFGIPLPGHNRLCILEDPQRRTRCKRRICFGRWPASSRT